MENSFAESYCALVSWNDLAESASLYFLNCELPVLAHWFRITVAVSFYRNFTKQTNSGAGCI
jgi:hypothetical protein